jgi:hypothetical protein
MTLKPNFIEPLKKGSPYKKSTHNVTYRSNCYLQLIFERSFDTVIISRNEIKKFSVDGMRIGRVNRSTRKKPSLVPLCPLQTPIWPHLGWNSYRQGGKSATNRLIFLIRIVRGAVQLGSLGTTATSRPIVPAPGDYDDGEIGKMMIGRGNRSTRRKHAPVPLCPPQIPHACPDANPGRRGGKPATNRLSYDTSSKPSLPSFPSL